MSAGLCLALSNEKFWQNRRAGGKEKPVNFSLDWFVSPSLIQLHPGRPACFSFCSWSQPPSPVSSASPWRRWRWWCPVLRNFGLVYCPLGFSLNVKVLECLLEGQLEMMLFHTQEVLFYFVLWICKLKLLGLFLDSLLQKALISKSQLIGN